MVAISTNFLISTQRFLQLSFCNLKFLLFAEKEKNIYYYDNKIFHNTLRNVVLGSKR